LCSKLKVEEIMSKISIRHTLQAVVGALLVVLPLIGDIAKNYPKLSWLSAGTGFLLALFANPKVVLAAQSLLDLFFPDVPAGPTGAPGVSGPTGVTGVTGPLPQQKDGGFIAPRTMFTMMFAAVTVMFILLMSRPAHSQTASQKYGGCLTPASYGQICVGPRAGVLVTRYDFTGPLSGKFTGGFQPGAGYGIILQSADPMQNWKMIEFDLFGSAMVGGSGTTIPSSFALTGMLTFFNYVTLGGGSQWTEQAVGSAKSGLFITGGLTLNIGGMTPAQSKAHMEMIKKVEAEEKAKEAKMVQ
jgi:hypothetical protein